MTGEGSGVLGLERRSRLMMVFTILAFAITTFFVSFLIGRMKDYDKGKIAVFTTLIAWGSLMCGLYLAKNIH
jgi:ABC-type multidrug transport system permease subunit